jgi:hypothetical protein
LAETIIASDSFVPGFSLSGILTMDVGDCGLAQAVPRSTSKKAMIFVLDIVSSLLGLSPDA